MDSKEVTLWKAASELNPHQFFSESLSFAELGVTSETDTNEVADQVDALASTDLNCNLHPSTDRAFITSVWEGATKHVDSFDRQLSATYPFNSDIPPPSPTGSGSSPEYHLHNINCNINRFLISGTVTKKSKPLSAGNDSFSLRAPTTERDSPKASWAGTSVVNSADKRAVCHKTHSWHKRPECGETTREPGGPAPQGSATSTLSQSYKACCGTMTSNSTGSPSSQVNAKANQGCMSVGGQKHITAAAPLPKPKSMSNFALCSTSPQVIDHQSWLLGSIPAERHFSSVWASRSIGLRDSGKNGIGRTALAISSSDGDSKCAKARWGSDATRRPRKKGTCPPKTKCKVPQNMRHGYQNTSSFNSAGTSFVASEEVEPHGPQGQQQKRITSTPFADTNNTRTYYGSTQSADDSAVPFFKARSSSELPPKKEPGQNMSVRVDSYTQTRARLNDAKKGLESKEFRRRPSCMKIRKSTSTTKLDGEPEERHDQQNSKSGVRYKSSKQGRETSKEFETTNRGKIQREKIEKHVKRVKKKKPKRAGHSTDQDMICSTGSSCDGLSDLFNPIQAKQTGGWLSSRESSSREDLIPSKSFIIHQQTHQQTHSSVDPDPLPCPNFGTSHVQQRSIEDTSISPSGKSNTFVDARSQGRYAEDEDSQKLSVEHVEEPTENRIEENVVEKKPIRKRKKKTVNQCKRRTNNSDLRTGVPDSGARIRKQGSFSRNTQLEAKTSSPRRRLGQQTKSTSAKIVSATNAKAKKNLNEMSRAASSAVVGKPPERKISPLKSKFGYLKNPRPRRSSQPEETKNPPLSNEKQQQLPVVKPGPSSNSAKNYNSRTDKVCRKPVERSPSLSKFKTNADDQAVKRTALSESRSNSKRPVRPIKNDERVNDETRRVPRIASETRRTQLNVSSAAQAQTARTYANRTHDTTPSVTDETGTEVNLFMYINDRKHDIEPRAFSPVKKGVVWRQQSGPSMPLENVLPRKCSLSPTKAKMALKRSAIAGPSSRGLDAAGKAAPKKLKYASRSRAAELTESTSSVSATHDSSAALEKKMSGSTLSNLKFLDYTSSQERQDLAGGDQGASGSSGGYASSSFVSTKSLTNVRLEQFRAILHRQQNASSQASAMSSSGVFVSATSYLVPLRNLAWNSSRDRPSFAEDPSKENETHDERIEFGIIFVMLVIQILLHYFVATQ